LFAIAAGRSNGVMVSLVQVPWRSGSPQAVFGVVEITGEPANDPGRERWAWSFAIRPLAVVTDLDRAPPVEAAGIFPQSLWRHSHIRLTEEQFESARKLIEAAAK